MDLNKTHCDRCGLKINKGEGIYADGGFYHRDICYEEHIQEYIDNYKWDEYKTYNEPEAICPYCGYVEHDSWELGSDDGINTCGRCDRGYKYYRNIEVTYTTEPIEGNNLNE